MLAPLCCRPPNLTKRLAPLAGVLTVLTVIAMSQFRLARAWVLVPRHGSRASKPARLELPFGQKIIQSFSSRGRNVNGKLPVPITRHHYLSSTRLASSSSSSSPSWQVGDAVLVPSRRQDKNAPAMLKGKIEAIRGGGWYTVRLEDSQEVRKVRSTKLVMLEEHEESMSTISGFSNDTASFSTHQSTTMPIQNDSIISTEKDANMDATIITASPTKLREEMEPHETTSATQSEEIDSEFFNVQELPLQEGVQAIPAMTVHVAAPEPNASDDTTIAANTELLTVPPPPRMDDLDAWLRDSETPHSDNDEFRHQIAHHASVKQWVVFTDLHCAPSTLPTTLQVLERVHQLAQERNAGVLFLGDFWHHRGTLRVDCLNAVLGNLRHWQVPMIMIPGNHDQVTLGGHSHGLTPLEHAYRVTTQDGTSVPGPLVLSHPTLLAGALFVPHIRDIATLESVLQSTLAQQDATRAIFVHADVTGAYMNDLIVSTGGIHPRVFPSQKPIYSGHFHKPHTVTYGPQQNQHCDNKNRQPYPIMIEYLGSPYETSLAEAHQAKSLVVLDASKDWRAVERIPVSLGRKHFKCHSLQDLLALVVPDPNTMTRSDPGHVRDGDRVVVTLARHEMKLLETESHVEDHIRNLRKHGVAVEVRDATLDEATTAAISQTPALEDLSPTSTWKWFWEEQIQRRIVEADEAAILQKAGLDILEELEESIDENPSEIAASTSSDSIFAKTTNLQLDSVVVEGYGPFPERIEYPLHDRGLVLLRGSNWDGGSDSNGSGKTSLAMAPLWALTGSADPRPLQDSKVADVVNDSKQNARVSLSGHLNGKPFTISRTKTPKKSGLAFFLNNHDLTTQSVKETMAVIEEKLGVSAPILARTMFHGQHSLNNLLEATDTKLKEELSLVVPLELWQSATGRTRKKSRDATKKENELQGMISLRIDDMDKLRVRSEAAAAEVDKKEEILATKENDLKNEKIGTKTQDVSHLLLDQKSLSELRNEAAARVEEQENELQHLNKVRTNSLQDIQKSLARLVLSAQDAAQNYQKAQLEFQSATFESESLQKKLNELEITWEVDLSSGSMPVDFLVPDRCPTCLQPLNTDVSSASNHEHGQKQLQIKAENEINQALSAWSEAKSKLSLSKDTLEQAKNANQESATEVSEIQRELQEATSFWEDKLLIAETKLKHSREEVGRISEKYASNAERLQEASIVESSLESELKLEREAARFARNAHEELMRDLQSMEDAVEQLRAERKECQHIAKQMSQLTDAFGNRGIQTFVLQKAVTDLESLTQSYLDDLSDGGAQRLQLSLDAGDRVTRRAFLRDPDGSFKERPLASLSGGQWRRCSLALTLGFADLVARRGRLRPSIIVLDEPLTHLDRAGRADVGTVLRRILGQNSQGNDVAPESTRFPVSTIIMILQDLAAEELEESFDRIDEVVKKDGMSFVKVDEASEG